MFRMPIVLAATILLPGAAMSATCLTYQPRVFPDTGTCVNAEAFVFSGGAAVTNIGTPVYGPSSVDVVAGLPDLGARASAFAGPGILRLTAHTFDSGSDRTDFASARAQAGFADLGRIVLPGADAGDPVTGFVTLAITGTATDHAGIGPAYPHLNVAALEPTGTFRASLYNLENPVNGHYAFSSYVGDNLFVSLGMEIHADAVTIHPLEFADYGHTARLFIDFTTPDAFVDAVSGHDYHAAAPPVAPVPLPAGLPLMATGFGALVILRSLRRLAVVGTPPRPMRDASHKTRETGRTDSIAVA